MNDDVKPTSLRRIGAAAGGMFLLVFALMAIQMARGHDPALGTTPKATHVAARRTPDPVTAPPATGDDGQAQPPPAYGDDQGYQYEPQQQVYQAPQAYQPPPVQSTTS